MKVVGAMPVAATTQLPENSFVHGIESSGLANPVLGTGALARLYLFGWAE